MATIKDVAQRAKVSIATVSYVLNGTGAVSEQTRQSVLAAAQALDYRPSYRARALQSRRSMSIGLLLPGPQRVAEPSFGTLLAGMSAGAAAHGYGILLATPTPGQNEASLLTQLWTSGRIDGAVLLDVQMDDERVAAATAAGVPHICAGRPSDGSAFVAVDGVAGMLEAMAHLIVRGHEAIALLHPSLEAPLADELDEGYRTALDEAGIPFDAALIVEGGRDEAAGYAATADMLQGEPLPTAIVAGSSALAFGALHALHDEGVAVGRDIALISFEDTPAAAHTAPPLTALRQPFWEWGRALAEGLVEILDGKPPPRSTVSPQLIVRRSCGEAGKPGHAVTRNVG